MNIQIIKRKAHTFIKNPKTLPTKILYKMSPILSDEDYLNLLFPLKTGYKLNLQNPKTFNEKLQWLKLNYRKPIMTQMADKYRSKSYVRALIRDEYIVKIMGFGIVLMILTLMNYRINLYLKLLMIKMGW